MFLKKKWVLFENRLKLSRLFVCFGQVRLIRLQLVGEFASLLYVRTKLARYKRLVPNRFLNKIIPGLRQKTSFPPQVRFPCIRCRILNYNLGTPSWTDPVENLWSDRRGFRSVFITIYFTRRIKKKKIPIVPFWLYIYIRTFEV